MNGLNPREIALRVLLRGRANGEFAEPTLEAELDRAGLPSVDRRLAQELVYGVVRWQGVLDWLIGRKTKRGAPNAAVRQILRLGLYQLFWLDRVPAHAAVHETVHLAKQSGWAKQAGFINALLRGYAREEAFTRQEMAVLQEKDPAVYYSHPHWLYERWRQKWGAECATRLLAWNNTPPPTYARVNALLCSPEQLIGRWKIEGVRHTPRSWDWTGDNLVFELQSHPPLTELYSFQHGWFYVQDPSTLLAVGQLAPQPGETILDVCAAPGGKTSYIAQCLRNCGRIEARDVNPTRLERLRENCRRLGVSCVEPVRVRSIESAAGGAASEKAGTEGFDRILIDAPCSNTGVMRRRINLRHRLRPEEIRRLQAVQRDLLSRAVAELKPGGSLVYSTCSLEPEENQEVTHPFLTGHPEFEMTHERLLLPFKEGVDGAYAACFRRKRSG